MKNGNSQIPKVCINGLSRDEDIANSFADKYLPSSSYFSGCHLVKNELSDLGENKIVSGLFKNNKFNTLKQCSSLISLV
mgnify:CR=1 FL=1